MLGLGAVALVIFGIVKMLNSKGTPRRTVPEVVQLKLLPPPPPPPPPPPKIEPLKLKIPELKMEQPEPDQPPEPKTDAPPALDAAGEGAGDAFGLAGHPGGADFAGRGGGGSRFGAYKARLKSCIQDAMRRRRRLKDQRVELTLQVWATTDGRLERVVLARSSGHPELDSLTVDTAASIDRCQGLPADMPAQPMYLQLSVHGRNADFAN